MSMIGLHDGQEITARAPTAHTLFRVCTNIKYAKVLVQQLDMPGGLPAGARYRIVLEDNGGRKEEMYVFSDGGESEFQFHRARKVAVDSEHAREEPAGRKGVMVLYLMKLDQHPDAMYVVGWRRSGSCQLTKVDGMAWTPKYHAGRERDLKVGCYCVREYLGDVDQVLQAPENVLVMLRDGNKHNKCEACG